MDQFNKLHVESHNTYRPYALNMPTANNVGENLVKQGRKSILQELLDLNLCSGVTKGAHTRFWWLSTNFTAARLIHNENS